MEKRSLAGLLIAFATSCVTDLPTSERKNKEVAPIEKIPTEKSPTEKATPGVKPDVDKTERKRVVGDKKLPLHSEENNIDNPATPDFQEIIPQDKFAGLPWDEKLAQAIQVAEKYNCMPNTISIREELNPAAKAELEELYSMAIVLANLYADDALRLVDHPCPTVRVYALMALRSWAPEHYSPAMLEKIPKLHQTNVCGHDDADRSREWMKGVIKELHEIPKSPFVTKDPVLQKQTVEKADAFVRKYAQFPASYISLSETTPAYPRCQAFVSQEGVATYYLDFVCFLNDKSAKQHKLWLHFQFDENLEISPSLPFSAEFCRNLTPKENAVFYPEQMQHE